MPMKRPKRNSKSRKRLHSSAPTGHRGRFRRADIESLEERRVLAMFWVAPAAAFDDPANPGNPQAGDLVAWPAQGQFAQGHGGDVLGPVFGTSAFTSIQTAINAAHDGDTIEVDPGIYLEHLTISKSLTLEGADANTTTINGAGSDGLTIGASCLATLRRFTVTGCNNAIVMGDDSTAFIANDVITNNQASGVTDAIDTAFHNVNLNVSQSTISGNGSGIDISGFSSFVVAASKISGNTQSGIKANHGLNHPMINNSTITDNGGDGIALSGSDYSINDCTITGNRRTGIYASSAAISVTGSTIADNGQSGASSGGGIFSSSGEATVKLSTIAGNRASDAGGGIYSASGSLAVVDSTIANNSAGTSGGGIYFASGSLQLLDNTISGNSATVGGGVYAVNANAAIGNTIVAGNTVSGNSANDPDVFLSNASTISDHDLIGIVGDALGFTDSNGAPISGNLVGTAGSPVNAMLAPLANNGGSTQTMVPLPGSPALGSGDAAPTLFPLPSTDQRRLPRIAGGAVDIGAMQSQTGRQIDLVTDPGDGAGATLRNVIAAANPGDVIELALPSGTTQIALTQGQIEINKNLTIQGPGASLLTIEQTTASVGPIFQVDASDANNNRVNLSLSGMTFTVNQYSVSGNSGIAAFDNAGNLSLDDVVFSGNAFGALYNLAAGTATITDSAFLNNVYTGAIDNQGTLSVADSVLFNNAASKGGGIYNQGATTATHCFISGNTGSDDLGGGGIYNVSNATIAIVDSLISANRETFDAPGGGIANYGRLTLQGSTLSDNFAQAGNGGGLYNDFSGNATVTESTISHNTANGSGGGIENNGVLVVSGSTISGNSAHNAYLPGNGGGIENTDVLVANDCTISGNSADGGGGIDGWSGGSLSLLANTIVAGNHAATCDPDVAGDFSSQYGYSYAGPSDHDLIGIVGDATGFTTSGPYASLIGTADHPLDPKLGPLTDNGGPSLTMALLPGSPAIDAGDDSPPSDAAGQPLPFAVPATDDRGLPRIVNGAVDIGAFELSRITASMSGNYTIKLVQGASPDQTQTEILDPSNHVVFSSPVSVIPSLIFANSTGQTVNLTVDYTAGDPLPSGGLSYVGGGNDGLSVTGYNVDTVADRRSNSHDGTLQVGSGAAITYSGLSSLGELGVEANLAISLSGGAVNAALQDDGSTGNNISQLIGTSGTLAMMTFAEPTSSLSINGGDGGDTITVARSFANDFNANLKLLGGAGDDTFNVYATPTSGVTTIDGGGTNGNTLNDFMAGDAELWSNAATPPVVSIATSGQAPLTYASIQHVNVTPGNGVVNVYGDNNQPGTSQNDGYQVVGTGANALTLALSGNTAAAASYSLPINFSGVRTLNAYGEAQGTTNAHNDANQLAITPYADNTPQGWRVQTFWNEDDKANDGDLLIYNGVAGTSENIVIVPSAQGTGQLYASNAATNTPVAVVNYALNTNIAVNGNDGAAGDSDSLSLKGLNPGASGSQQFAVDYPKPGSSGAGVRVTEIVNGKVLYRLASMSNFAGLNLAGGGSASQNTLVVEGYDAAGGAPGALDASLTAALDRSSSTAGVVSVFTNGAPVAATQYPEISYAGIGTLNVNTANNAPVQGPDIAFGSPKVPGSGLDGASDSGIAGQPATLADRITSDSTPAFYGTAASNSIVRLYVDANGNGKVDSSDVLIGQATASSAGGQDGSWTIASNIDLNDPRFGFAHDGPRTILATAEDGAGDVSSPQSLTIFLDTQGPQVGGVSVTGSPGYNLFLQGDQPTPTPLVNSLDVTFSDSAVRGASFVFPAVDQALASTIANYQLIGRTNGPIPIASVTFSDATTAGAAGKSVATLHFAAPLPDDSYTLTISDRILDDAGNALDGEFNGSSFPSGNASPGGAFTGSFVVNSRPHLAVARNGGVSLDINGDGLFNPSNTASDSDLVETFALPNDRLFSGKFASPNGTVSGFDQLGAYGFANGQWRWLMNTDPTQGTSNPTTYAEPLRLDGQPVAGYFAGNRTLGMQVGLFNQGTWWLDVLNHHTIDSADTAAGGQLRGNMKGAPLVGDFDGDGKTDLATYQNGVFQFDLSSRDRGGKLTGNFNATINAQTLVAALQPAQGNATPVAADVDGDGISDLGLVVTGAGNTAQWFWLVSNDGKDAGGVNPAGAFAAINHTFNPAPLGHDLSYQYGDPSGIPLTGIWDPPTSPAFANSNPSSSNASSGGWIASLYQTVLGRQPSAAETTNWNNALASGQFTKIQISQSFLESGERLGSIIGGYYQQYLGRDIDQAGLNYWIGVWRASGGPEQVQAGIIASPEYYATAGKLYANLSPDAAWVTALYNNILGRSPDEQGLAYWVNYIQTHSKQSVVLGFVTSAEYRLGLINGWSEEYLGRPIDASGGQYWLAQMQQGMTQDLVQAAMLASDEFASRS